LTVSEDGCIDAFEELPDGVLDKAEYIFLGGLWGKDVVEFHVGMVPWPSDLQGVVLHDRGNTS
jgi:hypothetical protein